MEYKACSIEYFLDHMASYELSIILENINYCVKNDWEQTREIMWSNLVPWSGKKKIKTTDVLSLPWDEKVSKPKVEKVEVTEELRQQMLNKSLAIKESLIASGAL